MNLLHQPHLTAVILLIWSGDTARFDYRLANSILNIWRSQSILWPELNSTENLVNEFATFVFFTIFKFGEVNFYIKDKFTCRWARFHLIRCLVFLPTQCKVKEQIRADYFSPTVSYLIQISGFSEWLNSGECYLFFFSFFFFSYIYIFILIEFVFSKFNVVLTSLPY